MKNSTKLFSICILLMLQSCCYLGNCEDTSDDFIATSQFKPVFLSRSDLNTSVTLKEPQEIVVSGKIYTKGNLLFVGEKREGFHVFDNTNPANPQKIKFIKAPGSTDLAIRDNTLYINQATDLVAASFNITDSKLEVTKRVENIFPELVSPDGFYADSMPENAIVVNWILKN